MLNCLCTVIHQTRVRLTVLVFQPTSFEAESWTPPVEIEIELDAF